MYWDPFVDEESITEQDAFWLIRDALAPEFQDATPEEIGQLMLASEIEPATIAALAAAGAALAPVVIPLVTGAVQQGTQAIGRLVKSASRKRRRPPQRRAANRNRPAPPSTPSRAPIPPPPPSATGQQQVEPQAMNQLLSALTRPEVLQAILSGVLSGSGSGSQTVQVGNESITIGRFFTMLEHLARPSDTQPGVKSQSHGR